MPFTLRPGAPQMRWCQSLFVFLLIAPSLAFCQDELTAVPNRPTVSTTAEPVQPGVLETEWGVDATSSHQDINALLKFGLTENFELRFANNPLTADSGTHGFGDTSLGFKYRFNKDSGYEPSIAVIYMLKSPSAGDVLGSGQFDHSFAFLASKDLGKHHFDFNCIANLLGRPQRGFDRDYLNALAWSHPMRGKWGATAEFSGITSDGTGPGSAQFLAAATYTARSRLVFDCGISARITGEIPHAMLIAGFTYSIADFYHHNSGNETKRREKR